MKKNLHPIALLTALSFLLLACSEKEDISETGNNKYVNSWIYNSLNTYYFWNTKIPANVDNTIAPGTYFESLLYRYNKTTAPDGDRFSWIQANYLDLLESLQGVASNEIGFEYKLYLYGNNKVFGEIAYIKKGTDAANKNLKRGLAFTHIGGTPITYDNYKTLLALQSSSVTIRVCDVSFDSDIKEIVFENEKDVTLNLTAKYAENPVYLDTVYTNNGNITGYLVYNFFAADKGDETGAYDLALNNAFAKFSSQGINNLIVDLRYNSGGSLRSAVYLASMIVKNLNPSNIFLKQEYNSFLQAEYEKQYGKDALNYKFTDQVTIYDNNNKAKSQVALNNIGTIEKLYVLTGNNTASASEMVINGLKPYMDVYTIGDTTIGKNVGSVSLYVENDPKNTWGMQPIIAKFYNKNNQSDFTAGFVPDVLDRDTWNMPKKQLGDTNEALLSKALSTINKMPIPYSLLQNQNIHIREIRSSLELKGWRNQTIIPTNSLLKIQN